YDLFGDLRIGATDPRLLSCQQAGLDAQSASALFAATTPVQQRYDSLVVESDTLLEAGPGVHVIEIAGDLRITPGSLFGNSLFVVSDVDTELVVINVGGNLAIADDAFLSSDFPGGMVINLTGARSKVKIGRRATVDLPILAPNSAMLIGADASVANLWSNKKVSLLGAIVSDALVCDVPEEPAKVVFVTSDEYDGEMVGGLAGADALCQELAGDALLSGTFKAWLSDSTGNTASRISKAIVPYTLVDGTVVANNWTDLTDGTLAHAIDQDESGFDLDPLFDNLQVWSATSPSGQLTGDGDCDNWTTADDFEDGAIGDASASDSEWTDSDFTSCDDSARLYCIQQ
ncbi:MAG TPA: hypothetical protein VEB21_02725, partial [Terriglobales bacterium]|nr:hypothetical protein [Terriglobales bacterium]